ncbi:hypothetical protein GCM10027059_38960 [Myceligenerans halotolerans]
MWRPTGPEELALVEASGWRAWPPRLVDQPIFYVVGRILMSLRVRVAESEVVEELRDA